MLISEPGYSRTPVRKEYRNWFQFTFYAGKACHGVEFEIVHIDNFDICRAKCSGTGYIVVTHAQFFLNMNVEQSLA